MPIGAIWPPSLFSPQSLSLLSSFSFNARSSKASPVVSSNSLICTNSLPCHSRLRKLFQECNQRRVILFRRAKGHERVKKLMDQRGSRQWCAIGAPGIQRNVEVFVMQAGAKTRLEVVSQKAFAMQFE